MALLSKDLGSIRHFMDFMPWPQMREYKLKTVIPTESDSKGLHYDGDLYFASNTHIYKYSQSSYSMISTAQETIQDFCIGDKVFVITHERMYMNSSSAIVATLRSRCTSIAISDKYIALGCSNILEIWHIPREFKFTLFKLHSRSHAHFQDITSIRFVSGSLVLTGSRDCTVRLLDIDSGKSLRVCSTKGVPIALHSEGSRIMVVSEDGMMAHYEYSDEGIRLVDRIFLDASVSAASFYSNFLAVFIDKDNGLLVYRDFELAYSTHTIHSVREMCLCGDSVALKGRNFVGIYNLVTDLFVVELALPKISCMAANKELLAAGCSDKKVRIYDRERCICTLEDPSITHALFNVHFTRNTALAVSVDGRISVWDAKNGTCYRSFKIDARVCATEMDDDGILLFIADFDSYAIRVIDLQRSKEVDSLSGHTGPVHRMRYDGGYLYSLGYDNVVRRWDVYRQDAIELLLEKTGAGLAVRNGRICISCDGDLAIYDSAFNYESSIKGSLKSRRRDEVFISEKPMEHLDFSFDGKFIIAGGAANKIKVLALETSDEVQGLKASNNRDWENYKEMLGKESTRPFDKTKIIDVLKIVHSETQQVFYSLTREGISIYGASRTRFAPLNLDVELTPKAIQGYLESEEYYKAMYGSLRTNEYEIVKSVLLRCPADRVESVVKYLDEGLAENLRLAIATMLENPAYHSSAIRWLKFVVYYFSSPKFQGAELGKLRKAVDSILSIGKLNRAMLTNILKKK
jgi:periodic tryptophan protein 2